MNLNQVTIQAKNIEESILFYQKLGLELIVHTKGNYARFICPHGNSTFSLHHSDSIAKNKDTWLYFEVENVDITIKKLDALNIKIEEYPNDKPWLWREARIRDLDQNILIIYHAGGNRINPPWKIK